MPLIHQAITCPPAPFLCAGIIAPACSGKREEEELSSDPDCVTAVGLLKGKGGSGKAVGLLGGWMNGAIMVNLLCMVPSFLFSGLLEEPPRNYDSSLTASFNEDGVKFLSSACTFHVHVSSTSERVLSSLGGKVSGPGCCVLLAVVPLCIVQGRSCFHQNGGF